VAVIGQVFVQFDIWNFYKNLFGNPKFVEIGQKYWALHVKIQVYFILLAENALLCFDGNTCNITFLTDICTTAI
jgi:hypothetical protein